MTSRRDFIAVAGMGALGFGSAVAQSFPVRPIRLVVPYPAGGTTDVFVRMLAPVLEQRWGQPLVADFKPGGGTVIGTAAAAQSAADGHTLVIVANSLVINAKLHKNLPYDSLKGFTSVAVILDSPQVMAVNAASPYKTLAEWVAAARNRPGALSLGTVGPATTQHIAFEMLKRASRTEVTYVPFAGGSQAVNSLLGGHVDSMIGNYAELAAHFESGKLRPLAVTGAQRLDLLKDVPTVAESGYPGYDVVVWFGISAPAGTPPDVVARLADDFKAALADSGTQQRLLKIGLVPAFKGPAAMTDHVRQKYEQFARVIDEAGIKLD